MNSILSLLLPFFSAWSAPAAVMAPASDGPVAQARTYDPLLGGPLKVEGREIPELEIKRFLAHGLGAKQLDRDKFQIIIENELQRRKAAGEDISKFRPTKADIDKKIEKDRVDFLLRYPTLDFAIECGRAYLSVDLYREQAEQAMMFDRIFTPDDPDQWPPLTREVITAEGDGPGLIDDAKESYEKRKQYAAEQGQTEVPPDDPIWVDYMRNVVLEALMGFSAVETNPEKLQPGWLASVDGQPVMIEQVYQRIRPHVTPDLVSDARKFLAIKALAEADFAKKGVLESRETFEKTFDPGNTFAETLVKYGMLAVSVQGFPSMESWVDYMRWFHSYQKVIADDLKDDAKLMTVLGPCNAMTAAAKVNVEVILASAYDDPNNRWRENGWAYAEQRAKEIRKELDGGADWKATLENKSEFWDPPMPDVGQKPQYGFNFKGAFGEQTHNQLLGFLRESEYRVLLDANSVTDYIFFKQRPGTIEGPLKGVRGYYISRVTGTTPPMKPLNMKDPAHRDLVTTHYTRAKLFAYLQDLLSKGIAERRVEGI